MDNEQVPVEFMTERAQELAKGMMATFHTLIEQHFKQFEDGEIDAQEMSDRFSSVVVAFINATASAAIHYANTLGAPIDMVIASTAALSELAFNNVLAFGLTPPPGARLS